MNNIKNLVIKQIRFCYINDFINILKQLEEKKFKTANEYDRFLYEWEQIEQLWNEINKM